MVRSGGWVYVERHGEAHLARTWQTVGAAALPEPGWGDILVPVTVGSQNARAIAVSYGLEVAVQDADAFPLWDWLHLRV